MAKITKNKRTAPKEQDGGVEQREKCCCGPFRLSTYVHTLL